MTDPWARSPSPSLYSSCKKNGPVEGGTTGPRQEESSLGRSQQKNQLEYGRWQETNQWELLN